MSAPTIEALLKRIGEGEREAWSELVPQVYATLQEIAHRLLLRQAPGRPLQTTALVHEAYLRLLPGDQRWETRRHFERVAARAMRCVLVDEAREDLALKRGGEHGRVRLTHVVVTAPRTPQFELLALDEALERLQTLDPESAEIVELRCFGGLEHEEIARVLGRSPRTIARLWRFARSWLERELGDPDDR